MLEQLIQPITGPYSHSGFGDFISIKLVTLGYTSAFKSSRESTRAPSLAPRPRAGCHLYLDTQHVERIVSFPPLPPRHRPCSATDPSNRPEQGRSTHHGT